MSRRRARHSGLAVAAVAALGASAFVACSTTSSRAAHPARRTTRSATTRNTTPPPPAVSTTRVASVVVLGSSARGRRITAVHWAAPAPRVRIVVFGCIHGDEPAGIAVTQILAARAPPSDVDLWAVDDINPDGLAANTRLNANGVDLNRNFPYAWRFYGRPGDSEYPGRAPLSEPETRAAHDLLELVHPTVTIWYHQHQDLVDESGGDVAVESRYATLVGLPLRRLTRYPGSAASWQNVTLAPTTAFVVELPAGSLSPRDATRHADAVLELV